MKCFKRIFVVSYLSGEPGAQMPRVETPLIVAHLEFSCELPEQRVRAHVAAGDRLGRP